MRYVEGLALVLLCSSRPTIRKRAVQMLRDTRNLMNLLALADVLFMFASLRDVIGIIRAFVLIYF